MLVRADLHIHSCLSPCGDLAMSPSAIVAAAVSRGLTMLAVCDHNSALNIPPFFKLCSAAGITAIAGIEITTLEEAHLLALFEQPETAIQLGRQIYQSLPAVKNRPEKFGDQVYVDEQEVIVGEVEKYLLPACAFSIDQLVMMIKDQGGLAVAAHLNRPSASLLGQLGYLPPLPFAALEFTQKPADYKAYAAYPLIASSDAHYIEDIGRRYIEFNAAGNSFADLRQALSEKKVAAFF